MKTSFKTSLRVIPLVFLFSNLIFTAKAQNWLLAGNTPTGSQFIGSTGAQDLIFKTNGTEYMRLIGAATNRGNFGIGTSTPGANLTVAGKRIVFGGSSVNGGYGGTDIATEMQATGSCFLSLISDIGGGSQTNVSLVSSSGLGGEIVVGNNLPFLFFIGGNERFRIASSGNTGIGTSAPANKLDVEGASVIGATYSGTNTAPTNGLLVEGNTGLGTSTVVNKLDVEGAIAIGSSYSGTSTAPSNGLIVQGNTGIGTSTVINKLDVEGGVAIGATYSGTNTAPTNGLLVEGNLGVGLTTIPSGGPSGGYKMAVSGNTNFIGGVVIGTTANFTAGTPFPSPYKLFVEGGILTEKLKVSPKTTADWSDYVFEKNYKLRSLSEVEKYVAENKHLPGIPSAQEVVDNGIDVAKMDAKLLEKIEELTLYVIEQQKQIDELKKQISK